jgi:hypothetical protein
MASIFRVEKKTEQEANSKEHIRPKRQYSSNRLHGVIIVMLLSIQDIETNIHY